MLAEAQKQRASYYNLAYVIEFQEILSELGSAVGKTCNAQISFWTHLQNPVLIDFNTLDEDNERIYQHVNLTDKLWDSLCKINSNYPAANSLYSEYQREIRNNDHLANRIQNYSVYDSRKKAITTLLVQNEILFDSKTAVVHVASSKANMGNVTKTNEGTLEMFGYTPIEFLHNSVNKIIPNALAKRHNEFMEIYFRTGRDRVLNKERLAFALHKKGYCFPIKLFVRPMPQLDGGYLQFVGMILAQQDDYEYIITDTRGNIDSVSRRLALKFRVLLVQP